MLKAWHRVANSKNRASSREKSSKMSPAPMQSIKNKRKTPSATTPTARNIGIRLNPQTPAPSTARRVRQIEQEQLEPGISNFVDQQDAQRFGGADQKAERNGFVSNDELTVRHD